jgi:Flp pilus assembly CpaF family ATPase
MLRTAFGPAIARFLEDPAIIEVMLNPDGRLWIDRLSGGLAETDERPSAPDGERIVRSVAHHVGAEVHAGSPRVELLFVNAPVDRLYGFAVDVGAFDRCSGFRLKRVTS